MVYQANFRQVANVVRVGSEILAHSQRVLRAERLHNNHAIGWSKKAAWPAIFLADVSKADDDDDAPLNYKSKDIDEAWRVFEAFAQLPYDNWDKKVLLKYLRGDFKRRSWTRADPSRHWSKNRQFGEAILVHLVQVLGSEFR